LILLTEKREYCIDNPQVRIHLIIEMIRWTGLAPWEFEFNFPAGRISTFLVLKKYFQVKHAGFAVHIR
jgi:hypothetical protein